MFSKFVKRMLIIILTGGILMVSCSSGNKSKVDGGRKRFAPCPDTPNCVSSLDNREAYFIEPFKYKETPEKTRESLLGIIVEYPRTKVITLEDSYLHIEFRTKLMRFVDDVEFGFDDEKQIINVRSASRVGYSDMGVSRKRIEELREAYDRR